MARRNKVSKGWFIFHLLLTICSGGIWLVPLFIWYLMKK